MQQNTKAAATHGKENWTALHSNSSAQPLKPLIVQWFVEWQVIVMKQTNMEDNLPAQLELILENSFAANLGHVRGRASHASLAPHAAHFSQKSFQ